MVIDSVNGSEPSGISWGISSPSVWSRLVSKPSASAMPIKVPVTLFVIERILTGSFRPYASPK